MKIPKLLFLQPLLALVLATSGNAAVTLYDNPFLVPGGTGAGGNIALTSSNFDWLVYTGSTATLHLAGSRVFLSDRPFKDAPVDTYGILGMDSTGGATIPKFTNTTTSVSIATVTEGLSFNWLQGNGPGGTSPLRLAIQIDSTQWYVTTQTYTTPPGMSVGEFASVDSTTAVQQSVSFSGDAANWTLLNFNPDTDLSLGGGAVSDLSGTITGLGFFTNDTSSGIIRIANFNVTAVPEPSTYALGAIGLITLGLIALRRRQKA